MGKAGYFLGVMGLIRGEKRFRIFHGMESGSGRTAGFSTLWKTFFHGVENPDQNGTRVIWRRRNWARWV